LFKNSKILCPSGPDAFKDSEKRGERDWNLFREIVEVEAHKRVKENNRTFYNIVCPNFSYIMQL